MGGAVAEDEEVSDDVGRRGFRVKKILEEFQESLSSIEKVKFLKLSCLRITVFFLN